MSAFQVVALGIGLMIVAYALAHLNHSWWLKDAEWSGTPGASRGDRVAGWIDNVAMLLIGVGLIWGLLQWLHIL